MTRGRVFPILGSLAWLLALSLFCSSAFGAAVVKKKRRTTSTHRLTPRSTLPRLGTIRGGPWTEPTYADSAYGDNTAGEDADVRRAAVEALGPYNGSVVVVDPSSGRLLCMVNQKIALGPGFQPCSTIKVSVALAALSEKVIEPGTKIRLNGMRMDLTYALAHSNNYFFANSAANSGSKRSATTHMSSDMVKKPA